MDKRAKYLITGASGFVGRNLYEYLKKANYDVIGTYYSKPVDGLIQCDLTDYKQVDKITDGIDYIFAIATKTYGAGVVRSNPNALVRENLYLNSNILDLAFQKKIKKVLLVSSSTVYQVAYKPLTEEELDLNKEPYATYMGVGWVKRYTEKMAKFYKKHGLNVNLVRPTGIYGKYDKYEEGKSHFLPAIIKRVLENQNPLIIWGSGHNVRDMIYIDNFIRDILLIFNNYNSVEPLNLCSGRLTTISEIVDIIVKYCDYKGEIIYDTTKPDAIPYRALCRNKFDTLFGKQNYKQLEDGIKNVIDWMHNELKNSSI